MHFVSVDDDFSMFGLDGAQGGAESIGGEDIDAIAESGGG